MLDLIVQCTSSYVVHSSFALIFPLHALYLVLFHGYSAASLRDILFWVITDHLAPQDLTKFPLVPFLRLASVCTLGITLPALLWYAAISLTSSVYPMSSVQHRFDDFFLASATSQVSPFNVNIGVTPSDRVASASYLEHQRVLRVRDYSEAFRTRVGT